MQNLPSAEVYEKEVKYMPWGILIAEIENLVSIKVPQGGAVLDLLCGTGNLLWKLQNLREDLHYFGVDQEFEYIEFARNKYRKINFDVANALEWRSNQRFDTVLVTGGLHHIPYGKQRDLIGKVSNLIKDNGFAIIADPYISDYSNEQERKIAAAQLGYEYLTATIQNGATDNVTKATADLIANDILLVEYKTSIKRIRPFFEEHFSSIEMHKTWPNEETKYGDYYFVLRK